MSFLGVDASLTGVAWSAPVSRVAARRKFGQQTACAGLCQVLARPRRAAEDGPRGLLAPSCARPAPDTPIPARLMEKAATVFLAAV